MDPAQAQDLLVADRSATVTRIRDLSADFDAMVGAAAGTNGDDEHDPEGSTIAFERAQLAAVLDQARAHLAELDHALERVAAGTYGSCERCGQPIPAERLAARPAAATCIRCAAAR